MGHEALADNIIAEKAIAWSPMEIPMETKPYWMFIHMPVHWKGQAETNPMSPEYNPQTPLEKEVPQFLLTNVLSPMESKTANPILTSAATGRLSCLHCIHHKFGTDWLNPNQGETFPLTTVKP